jgi:hypothetical protein
MDSDKSAQNTRVCTQWVFLRLLGVIYFIAFLSLLPQVQGLIGSHGISPATSYLEEIASLIGAPVPAGAPLAARFGLSCLLQTPTLFWFCPNDGFLSFLCWGGMLASLGIILSVATAPLLVVAWLFYLSLVNVGQDFLAFQWDILLLEVGFLAMFWADWEFLGAPWRKSPLLEPSDKVFKIGLWLFWWLLFRLMFMSGSVKLLSGDAAWWHLTALHYHYYTQPLPTPMAWFANQLPGWFQSLSVVGVFVIELLVPFFFFLHRPLRLAGAALTAFLQVLIMLTGNYTFFNLLTLALCVLLLDDPLVGRILPKKIRDSLITQAHSEECAKPAAAWRPAIRTSAIGLVAAFVVVTSLSQLSSRFAGISLLRPLLNASECFHVVNTYGLFAVMTTVRPEVDVQGSDDGEQWQSYVFRFKPGPLDRPPPVIEPFQPRLDWQMWFAALGSVDDNPWFLRFVRRLLFGTPEVLALLEYNPFPTHPPKYIRAQIYSYEFTDFEELRTTGHWWKRQLMGSYLPVVSFTTHAR